MTEIIDSQFGGSALYSPINGINNLNTGNTSLFSPKLSSIGFDGVIPSKKDTKNVELLKRGDYILLQTSGTTLILGTNYADADSSIYLIVNVFLQEPTDSQTTIKVIYNQQENDIVLTNGNTAYYMSDDWTSRDIGTYGWQLTSAGNAIFNNIAVRGDITATSGTIGSDTDYWYIGNSTYESPSHGTIQSFSLSQDLPTPNSGTTAYGIELDASGYIDIYKQAKWIAPTQYVITGTAGSQTVVVHAASAHSLVTGNKFYIDGITRTGITGLNGTVATITSYTSTTATFTTSTTLTNGTYATTELGYIYQFYTVKLSADEGLSFYNANGDSSTLFRGTYIPLSGDITLRAISGNSRSSQYISIPSANSDISSAGDNGPFSITVGESDSPTNGDIRTRIAIDPNEIQSSKSTYTSGSWGAWSTNKLTLNSVGGDIALGISSSVITSTGKVVFSNTTDVDITSGAYSFAVGDTSGIHMRFDGNEIQRMATATTAGQININTNGGDIKIGDTSFTQTTEIHGTNINLNTTTNDGDIYLGWGTSVGTNSNVRSDAIYYSTNTTAANMYISAGRIIYRSTASSERYKRDISDDVSGELDPFKILDINVVKFKYNNDYISETDSNYDNYVIGFIAEDVAQKYPIAASLDEEGNPENWNDRFLVPAMLKVIQSQQESIKSLEERLAILEG
jgi:hypothetical protein